LGAALELVVKDLMAIRLLRSIYNRIMFLTLIFHQACQAVCVKYYFKGCPLFWRNTVIKQANSQLSRASLKGFVNLTQDAPSVFTDFRHT